jgi:hypothetical protein
VNTNAPHFILDIGPEGASFSRSVFIYTGNKGKKA